MKLHEREPREQVGAGTGPLFEYQYTQAAVDSLLLFKDAVGVYCEWHDDYVVEDAAPPGYRFYQVKTKRLAHGPWTLNDLFGTNKRLSAKNQPAPKGSPFKHMLENALAFGSGCLGLVFVTNNDVDADVTETLDGARQASSVASLRTGAKKFLELIFGVHSQTHPTLTRAELLRILQCLVVVPARGNPDDGETQLFDLGGRIAEISEVDIFTHQAARMGRDVLDLVRARSGVKIEPLPPGFTATSLTAQKGIVVDDLLSLISLSPEGYRTLQTAKDPAALRALSRLHRFCAKNAIGADLIKDICAYKASWDLWYSSEAPRVDPLDLTALRAGCGAVISSYARLPSGASKTLAFFVEEARNLASRYAHMSSGAPIGGIEVLGLIFTIAVERGPR